MIIDRLDNRNFYSSVPGLAGMLDLLAELDADTESGEWFDLGEVGNVTVGEFTSVDPRVQTRFEAHRVFTDVHVVLTGREVIDVAGLRSVTPVTAYDAGSDIGFHEGQATVTVLLEPGWFVVCFPQDAHRPGVWVDGPARVLKAVGKLKTV